MMRRSGSEARAMESSKLLGWLKQGWISFVDPEREQRIHAATAIVTRALAKQKRDFSLKSTILAAHVRPEEAHDVCLAVYEQCLNRAWSDMEISEREERTLIWTASALQLSANDVTQLRKRKGIESFGKLLSRAIADGMVDDAEHRQLEFAARWSGSTVRDLVREYFSKIGSGFLRGIFTAAIEDGVLLHEEWDRYLSSAERLGFTKSEATGLIEPYAQTFVEHVLADAKSDGVLSQPEEKSLEWLLSQFKLAASFRQYIASEIEELRTFTEIAHGRLPQLQNIAGIELRAGELLHFHGRARYLRERQRKSGVATESFDGPLSVTDERALFSSRLKSFAFNHTSIIGFRSDRGWLEVRSGAKGAGIYEFDDKWRLASAIWQTAVAKSNQTVVESTAGLPGRHIPRTVRQRVYQRYGGRCAECGDAQYLEFDHIVPVAKGGSNSEENVQLLCRRCNLKKRDLI
jgi:hypothetical protein